MNNSSWPKLVRIRQHTLQQKTKPVQALRYILLILLVSWLGKPAGVLAQAGGDVLVINTGKVRVGDDARWAQPDWDDSLWHESWLYTPPDTHAVFWIRTTATVTQPLQPLETKGLYLSMLAAFEVYWDGVLIGQSGVVGMDQTSETPGRLDNLFAVPDSLYTPGAHTLAVRLSNFHRPSSLRSYFYGWVIGDYGSLVAGNVRQVLFPLFFLGGFLIIALYYGILFLLNRRLALLLFSLLCLSVSVLLVAESWRWTVGYTYDWHLTRLLVVAGSTCAIGMLLPGFFLVQFQIPHKGYLLGVMVVLLGTSLYFVPGYDGKSEFMFRSLFVVSLPITGWAVWMRRKGSLLSLTGVVLCLAALVFFERSFVDTYFFPAFGGLIVCLLASLGIQMKEQRQQREAALLTAARLEIELLKKNIQPHFLMNTLTSVMEWIEAHPQTGVQFIEALADELRMLSHISDKKLIPMVQELALCRAHLDVMSYRQDVRFFLDVQNVEYDTLVPPALFHTLIENGITHNAYRDAAVHFRLREERHNGIRRYTLVTPLAGPPTPRGEDGTGLRYVRARLEESFAGQWTLVSEPRAGGWATVIEMPA